MDGEQLAIAEQEPPAIGAEATTEGLENIPNPNEQGEGDGTAEGTEDDLDELDFGFKKYRVPKELKAAVEDWRSATTKKEQSVAEQARALEAKAAQQAEADEAELDARAELKGIKAQLTEFAKLTPQDWAYHMQNDPLGTQQAKMQMDLLKERAIQLEGTIKTATVKRTEAAQQNFAKRIQETLSEAPKIIPGWKPETANQTIQELVGFANSEGIPEQWLKDNWSPTVLKFLHRARIGTLAMQKQATAAPQPAAQQSVPTPLEKVAGRSSPTANKSLGDLAKSGNMEAYVAARKAGRVR